MSENTPKNPLDDPGLELAAMRTSLAFDRTRLSIDRTQMAVLRTSLAMIGFGFTIYKFFQELGKSTNAVEAFGPAARNFGLTLVILGVILLTAGLGNHYRSIRILRQRRKHLFERHLLAEGPSHSTSPNAVIAALLLIAGLLTMLGVLMRIGPFQ